MINILIIGAGNAGQTVLKEIKDNETLNRRYHVTGFIDDSSNTDNNSNPYILDIPILSDIENVSTVIKSYNIQEVIIAIPSAKRGVIEKILRSLDSSNVIIKIVPGVYDIINGHFNINQIRDIEITDLLGREEIGFNEQELIKEYLDQTILVTGGGGSIGSEIINQLLLLPIKKVIALGHGENSVYELIGKFGSDSRFDYIIGDVKDYTKLLHEFKKHRPDRVFHAAAHKHVPLMENYPDEAVKNNIFGTYNCAKASIESGVKRFNLVSTDKAVNPTSVMGTTKRIGEILIHSLNNHQDSCKLSFTRFGNVLGSKGSVVPLFKKQITKGGPLTVTHPDITRYFMSIPEAARLVLKAGVLEIGDLFILEMGDPIKITDLAEQMISLSGYTLKDIGIEFTGLRAGEKLYEELLTKSEEIVETGYDRLLVSHQKQDNLTPEQIKKLLLDLGEITQTYNNDKIKLELKKWVKEYQESICQ
ncbi:MAG: polysaccharide biosynthesis protein [Spirochaetaceae bacterium]